LPRQVRCDRVRRDSYAFLIQRNLGPRGSNRRGRLDGRRGHLWTLLLNRNSLPSKPRIGSPVCAKHAVDCHLQGMSDSSFPLENVPRHLPLTLMDSQRVEVYRNLHKNCYSVRALTGENKGRVIDHVQSITLTDAKFVVQPAGRDRVLREKRKNVHAFVRGHISNEPFKNGTPVIYDPYLTNTFIFKHYNGAVKEARQVHLSFSDDGHSRIEASI
jgi:hypothetical protein